MDHDTYVYFAKRVEFFLDELQKDLDDFDGDENDELVLYKQFCDDVDFTFTSCFEANSIE